MIVFLLHVHRVIWSMLFWSYYTLIGYDIHVVLIIPCNFMRCICYKFFSHRKTSKQRLVLVVFIFLEFPHTCPSFEYSHVYGIDSEVKCRFLITIRKLVSSLLFLSWQFYLLILLFFRFTVNERKIGLPPFQKDYVIFFFENPLKVMKNTFYFILKALFVLNIFKFLSWRFSHVGKKAWLER